MGLCNWLLRYAVMLSCAVRIPQPCPKWWKKFRKNHRNGDLIIIQYPILPLMIPLDRLIILIRTQHCSTTTDLVLVASAYNGGRWSMMRILREDFGIDHTQTHVPFLQNKNPKNKIGNKFFPFLSHPNQEGNANGQVFLPKTSPLQPQCLAI